MTTHSVTVRGTVPAAPDAVFRLIDDDTRWFEVRPNAIDHRDIEPLPTGGHACTQEYRVGMRTIVQRCTNLQFEPPHLQVDHIECQGLESKLRLQIEPHGEGSLLTYRWEIVSSVSALRGLLWRRSARPALRRVLSHLGRVIAAG